MKTFLAPERLFKLLMWIVALLFAWFLTGLGGLVIRDLPRVTHDVTMEQYASPEMKALEKEQKAIESNNSLLQDKKDVLNQALDNASSRYNEEHSNFENWLATRSVTEASNYNGEVVTRTKKLEQLKSQEQTIKQQIEQLDTQLLTAQQTIDGKQKTYDTLSEKSYKAFAHAQFIQEIKVFAFRLAIILPLLVVAAWLFWRKRNSKYWPFVWGYIIFALFSFFVELVPYLPSYGGYVRYAVGLIILGVAGYYGIDWMQRFLATRKAEAQASEAERRQKLDYMLAIKKLSAHVCPSCERAISDSKDVTTNYCMHCGLMLFKPCHICNTRHNAFFLYCPTCGDANNEVAK